MDTHPRTDAHSRARKHTRAQIRFPPWQDFGYEDDVVMAQLQGTMEDLRRSKLDLPPKAKQNETPAMPFGLFTEPTSTTTTTAQAAPANKAKAPDNQEVSFLSQIHGHGRGSHIPSSSSFSFPSSFFFSPLFLLFLPLSFLFLPLSSFPLRLPPFLFPLFIILHITSFFSLTWFSALFCVGG